ncbi:MAG: hypothetical protein VW877_07265 [Pseudomonadaceae bacterium]
MSEYHLGYKLVFFSKRHAYFVFINKNSRLWDGWAVSVVADGEKCRVPVHARRWVERCGAGECGLS